MKLICNSSFMHRNKLILLSVSKRAGQIENNETSNGRQTGKTNCQKQTVTFTKLEKFWAESNGIETCLHPSSKEKPINRE